MDADTHTQLILKCSNTHYDTTNRQLLRVIDLPQHVKYVYHAVETTLGTFVFGHHGMLQDKRQYAVSELFSFVTVELSDYKL